jgi:hypothetical protein
MREGYKSVLTDSSVCATFACPGGIGIQSYSLTFARCPYLFAMILYPFSICVMYTSGATQEKMSFVIAHILVSTKRRDLATRACLYYRDSTCLILYNRSSNDTAHSHTIVLFFFTAHTLLLLPWKLKKVCRVNFIP